MFENPVALDGVRVISFGAFVAGNTAAKLLAEMGADVIKVEARSRPEVLRKPAYAIGNPVIEPSGIPNTVMYASLSRGTRNVALDLSVPDARLVLHALVSKAHVVVENFGGPVLDRWGCSFEDLVVDNPRLVMLSLSGYGRSGPRAGYLGYASTLASYLGLSQAWGYTHGTLTDYVAAASGVVATIAALARARNDGVPTHVDIGQIDAMAPLLAGLYADPLNGTGSADARPNTVPGSWLSGIFPAAGYDAWLAVDIEDEEDWLILCAVMDRHDLRAGHRSVALENGDAMRQQLGRWAAGQTAYTAMHTLQKAGLAAAVVQTSEDIWRDPQLNVRGFPEQVEQPDLGTVTYPRSAQRWTKTPGALPVRPARLGEHSAQVLQEWLGTTAPQLQGLIQTGAIFDAG